MTLPELRFPLTIWHKPHAWEYYVENSKRGIAHAAVVGATAIDLDCHITADGHIIVTHWPRALMHGFADPEGKIHRNASVEHLTVAHVLRLRTHDGHRIWTAVELVEFCAQLGITPCFEVKEDRRFEKPETYEQLVEASRSTGVAIVIMTLPHLGGRSAGYRRLRAAKAAGLTTMVLTGHSALQRGRVPAAEWKNVDMAKGPYAGWGKPGRVIRMGAGSKYGCEVGDRSAARITRRLRKKWK